jgi:lysophospholipase L1-like esterase
MKKALVQWFGLAILPIFFFSCQPDPPAPSIGTEGKVDLSNYISIGNSLTAGYASGGLFLEGQKVAYPLLIASQFALCGGGEFNAPLFADEESGGTGYLRLDGFSDPSTPILTSVPEDPDAIEGRFAEAYSSSLNPDSIVLKPYTGPKNHNFGVPGIKVADILSPGYGNPNAFFGRMLRKEEKASANYVQKILEQNPTVFTCWLGNNDVLGFATAGGYADLGKVTPAATFSSNYNALLQGLQDLPSKPRGVLANIPDITSIPFFTTVTPTVKEKLVLSGNFYLYEFKFDSAFQDVVIPTFLATDSLLLKPQKINRWSATQLASLNPLTGNFEGDVFMTLTFSPYASLLGKPGGKAWKDIINRLVNTFVLPPPFDQVPKDTLLKIAWLKSGLDTLQPFGVSPKNPVPDVFVLNPHESGRTRSAVAVYNQIIKGQADARGLAFVDANAFMKNITRGAYFDAISMNAAFISGGAFSLDGVHLTPRGNALAANEFIRALNAKYGSKIPVLNPGQYKGVILP